ncbi:COX aromatic rich motif-containing protein [Marinomonas fungiae]|uniref:COX aromatic rich motif-containing protein n=1 Tax=Marinomonas fungiae TaxID=1137284 RepID=UPI003A8E82C3
MNSFFIPQLGSQIYSMAGMETKLHLIADEPGTFDGISANYSGHGFTGMKFEAIATPTREDFQEWVDGVKASGEALTTERYEALVEPTEYPVEYFGTVKDGLFFDIIWEYMGDMGRIEFYGKSEYGAELPEGVILPKRERTSTTHESEEASHYESSR